MDQVPELLRRQSQWQRDRASRLWADKLRDSVAMRHAVAELRKSRPSISVKGLHTPGDTAR